MSPRIRCLLALALICAATTVCAGDPPLIWRGDITTAHGVVNGVAKAWEKAGKGQIELQPFNTVSGIDAVAAGTADLAGSARGAAPDRAREANLVFTPVAWDALVMITHPRNPVDSLTLKQLHDIYYGKITNWSEVGGKQEPIHLYAVASPTDGVEFSLRRLLFGRGNQPVAAPRLYVNVAKLQEAVALDPKALGVTTMGNVHDLGKVKMLDIDGTRPSVANVADGSYPLYTPLYLVTRKDEGPKAAEVQQFVDFARGPKAAAVLRSHLLLPYADGAALAGHDQQRIAAIARETGRTVYHHDRPTAAPGATYASRAAIAPSSERTLEARQRLAAAREDEKATAHRKAVAAQAKASFERVHGEAVSSARPGFGTVSGSAHTVVAGSAKAAYYKVVSGDTLSRIARAHAVSVSQIRDWNDLDGNTIRVGQKLRISAATPD